MDKILTNNQEKTARSTATTKVFKPASVIQRELKIGKPNDHFEQQANRIADKVVSNQEPSVQRQCPGQEEDMMQMKSAGIESITPIQRQPLEEEEELLQPKLNRDQTPWIQRQEEEEEEAQPKEKNGGIGAQLATPWVENGIRNTRGGGSLLPNNTRSFMENRFGANFENIRVHTNGRAAQMNDQINAQAFTSGNDIFFNHRKYSPETQSGKRLLAHELTHTIQQGKGISNSSNKIQRDLATPRPTPAPAPQTNLTAREIRTALNYNRTRFDRRRTEIIQDLVGATITGTWDNITIELIAQLQEDYGLTKDGMVGPLTLQWLDNEQLLEGSGTDNNSVIYSFRVPTGNVMAAYRNIGGNHFIQAHFRMEAVFPERTGANNWEYRQEIRGNAWAQQPGSARVNLNHFFTLLPTPLHPTNWHEDGNTSWAGINYGHRLQSGRAHNPINRYEDTSGSPDQRNGSVYKGEDYPSVSDAALRSGDTITLELEFAGGIYRRDPTTHRLRIVERKLWRINRSVIVP